MKKTLTTLMALSLTVTAACSKNEKTVVIEREVAGPSERTEVPPAAKQEVVAVKPKNPNEITFEDIVALAQYEYPNPDLAELVYKEFYSQNQNVVQSWSKPLDSVQLLTLKNELARNAQSSVQSFYLGKTRAVRNETFLSSTVANSMQLMQAQGAFAGKFDLQVAVMAQSEALKRIFDVLNKQMERNAQSLAREIALDLKNNQPTALGEMDQLINLEQKKRVAVLVEMLKKYDRVLAKYDFSEDGTKIIIYGLVAGVLADTLSKTGTVKSLVEMAGEAKKVVDQINEMRLSIAALDKYRRDLKKNWEDVSSSFKRVKEDITYYRDHGGFELDQLEISDRSKASLSKAVDDVLDGRFSEEAAKGSKGLFTQAHPLGDNVKEFIQSAGKAADSFSGVITSVEVLSRQFGIKISPELQNAMKTANAVCQGVKLGSAIIEAYSSGGLVGALGSFSAGGPVMAAVGAGMAIQAQQQNEAYFKAILAELEEVKKLQRETIQLQQDTMQMVRDLAVMVDEYHKEDLFQMNQIYHQVVVNTEMSQLLIRRELRSCQSILGYLVSGRTKEVARYDFVNSINNVTSVKELIYSQINSLKSMGRLLAGVSDTSLDHCRNAMTEAFGLSLDPTSALYARFYVKEGKAQSAIEMRMYEGALRFLKERGAKGNSLEEMALHLPVAHLDALGMKDFYVYNNDAPVATDFGHKMRDLISPEGLETYASALLSLHSLISVNILDWGKKDDLFMAIFDRESQNRPYALSRSALWVQGALDQAKIAVAQNALLAGEPILSRLAMSWVSISEQMSRCKDLSADLNYRNFCFVRQNPLMMKNLLSYLLRQQIKAGHLNKQIYEKNLSSLLGVKPERIVQERGSRHLILADDGSLKVEIPSYSEIESGYIRYSEDMPELIKIHKLLAEESAKLASPKNLSVGPATLAKIQVLK